MQADKPPISRDDYLQLDEAATEKHEFYRGQMFAMAGGTYQHARIGLNVTTELAVRLRGKPCQPMNSDMRVATPSVLSPSTRSYDRGDKFMHYRSITSLQDYVLIDSEMVLVEHYQRIGTYEWHLHEYRQYP